MPNWCHNKLTVVGDPTVVKAFVEKVSTTASDGGETQPLTFNAHVPLPEEEGENWYEWHTANWGTKWDACFGSAFVAIPTTEAEIDPEANQTAAWQRVDGGLEIKFETAWAPPVPWLIQAGALEPQLTLRLEYAEPGMEFAGRVVVHNDSVQEEDLEVKDVLEESEMWF